MSFSLNTTGGVGSRFVSQKDLDEAKATKDKDWADAYARMGEAPPPRPQEEEYDPRSLYEKLQHNKDVKREQWDEKMKMGNQFRGLDSEEVNFLEATQREKMTVEAQRRREEQEILDAFRQAQNREPSPPANLLAPSSSKPSSSSSSLAGPSKPKPKPKAKGFLPPGVIVKKKAVAGGKPSASPTPPAAAVAPLPSKVAAPTPPPAAVKPTTTKPAAAPAPTPAETKKRPLPLGLNLGSGSDSDDSDDGDDGAPAAAAAAAPGGSEAKKARVDAGDE